MDKHTVFTDEQLQNYHNNPNACPNCGHDNIEAGHFEYEEDGGYVPVECHQCGFEWFDLYKHTGAGERCFSELRDQNYVPNPSKLEARYKIFDNAVIFLLGLDGSFLLEVVRSALQDADMFNRVCERMDISDETMSAVLEDIEKITENILEEKPMELTSGHEGCWEFTIQGVGWGNDVEEAWEACKDGIEIEHISADEAHPNLIDDRPLDDMEEETND